MRLKTLRWGLVLRGKKDRVVPNLVASFQIVEQGSQGEPFPNSETQCKNVFRINLDHDRKSASYYEVIWAIFFVNLYNLQSLRFSKRVLGD